MNITRVFSRRRAREVHKRRTSYRLAIAALSGAILLTSGLSSAEIYRWKDANGMMRYSNRPPDDPALLLDAMPLKQPPAEHTPQGGGYYLQTPGKETLQQEFSGNAVERLVLPSGVVEHLLTDTPNPAEVLSQPPVTETVTPDTAEVPLQESVPNDDMATLLSRVTDLEQSLQQAINSRMEWEQTYQQSLSQTEQLEQQNRLLRETTVEMQRTLQQFQDIVASSQNGTLIQPSAQTATANTGENDLTALVAAQSEQIRQQQIEIAQLRQDMQALKTTAALPSVSSGSASVSASPKLMTRGRIRVVERTTRRQEFAQISDTGTHLFLSQR